MKIIAFFRAMAIAEISLGIVLLLLSMTTSLHGALYFGLYIIFSGIFTWMVGLFSYLTNHYTETERERFQRYRL